MLVEQDARRDDAIEEHTNINSRRTLDSPEQSLGRESALVKLLQSCRTSAKAGQWAEVEKIAASAAATYPEEAFFYTQWAWALHQLGSSAQGISLLEKIADRFPRSVAFAYTLACLNGARRRVFRAKLWLDLAIQQASNPDKVKLRSLVQPELQCVWNDECHREDLRVLR